MNIRDSDTPESLLAFFNESYAGDHFYVDENGDFNVHISGQKASTFHFILIPVEKVNVLDKQGNIKDMRYKFYALREGATVLLEPITILKKELHNVNWIRRWNQFAVLDSITPKSYVWILQFLNHIDKKIPTVNELDLIGWHKDEQGWFFLHSGGKIGKSRQTYRTTFTEFKFLKNNSLSEEQAFKETIEMLNICDQKVTYALLSYSLLSLIVTPLVESKDLSPNFAMWIYGKTGLGKTRLSSLFTSFYDTENIVRVDSYKKDLKSAYTKHKDSVIVVDDYGTSKTAENEYRTDEKVENIIRWLGDRQLSSVDDALPTGMALFTGERFLNNNEKNSSTIARTIRISMDNIFNRNEPGFDSAKMKRFEKFEKMNPLSTSIFFYLDWLSEKLNSQMIDQYKSDFQKLRLKFESKVHSRIIDSISHLFNTFNFYILYAAEKEFITPLESQIISDNALQIFMNILEDQSKPVVHPQVELFLELLIEAIRGGAVKIALPHDLSYSNGRLNPSNGTLGIYYPDTEELKLVWESSYGILYQESRKRNEILVGVKKLGKLLEEANLILKSSSGITTPLQTQDENFRHSTSRAITFDARKIVNVSELIIKLDEQSKQDTLRYIEEWEGIEDDTYDYQDIEESLSDANLIDTGLISNEDEWNHKKGK